MRKPLMGTVGQRDRGAAPVLAVMAAKLNMHQAQMPARLITVFMAAVEE